MPKKIQKETIPFGSGPATFDNKVKDSLLPKIKPKQPMNGYMFFAKNTRSKLFEQNPTIKMTELAKKMGEMWTALLDTDKKPFHTLAEQDKARHDNEMEQFNKKGYFLNSDGVKSTDIITIKDFPEGTVLPKKPKSAWIIFNQENLKLLHKQNPTMKIVEIMKKSATDWSRVSKGKMTKMEKLSIADKQRYEKQVKELEKKGYFTSEDGTKSLDMKFKPKKQSREQLKIKAEKARSMKEKEKKQLHIKIEKARSLKEKEKLKMIAQKEKAMQQAVKEKAHKQATLLKLKESKQRELEKVKRTKLRDLEMSKKARIAARDTKLKAVSKKSKVIQKEEKSKVSKNKYSPANINSGLKFFTKTKIHQVLEQCSGNNKRSKLKEATIMIKEMWENAHPTTRHRYIRQALQDTANDN